jgi:hypothetical protein
MSCVSMLLSLQKIRAGAVNALASQVSTCSQKSQANNSLIRSGGERLMVSLWSECWYQDFKSEDLAKYD